MQPMRRFLPALAALLCLAPAGVAVSGCGDTADPIAEAAAATREAGGAKVQMRIGFEGGGAPKGVTMTADGVADMHSGRMRMTMDMAGLAGALGQSASKADPADLKTELRFLDKVLYIRTGVLARQLPKGKRWLKLDVEKIGQGLGVDVSQLGQYNDPTKMLDYLRSSGDVDEVGSDQIRGVDTKHYSAKVDIAKAAQKFKGAGTASGTGLDQLVKFLGSSKVPVDVWVGDDKLVRRMTMRLEPSGGAAAAGFSMNMNMDLFDYGTPVNVSAPPESETVDGATLLGKGSGAAAGAQQAP